MLHACAASAASWRRPRTALPTASTSTCADLADRVERILIAAGAPSEWIELEITESAAMAYPEGAVQVLQRLRERGIQVAMDDFGTGHSLLAMLRTLPLNVLKLDRSFVQHLPASASDAAVADAVVTLARRLGLTVVAEGVETEDQCRFLTDIGCELLQGFFFVRPLPVAEFEHWLATGGLRALAAA